MRGYFFISLYTAHFAAFLVLRGALLACKLFRSHHPSRKLARFAAAYTPVL